MPRYLFEWWDGNSRESSSTDKELDDLNSTIEEAKVIAHRNSSTVKIWEFHGAVERIEVVKRDAVWRPVKPED